jgi:hypothetical protein
MICFRANSFLRGMSAVSRKDRLTGGASAASEEAKPMSESAARAC